MAAPASNRFRAIVNLDHKGEILCFCPYDEYLQGKCVCREDYDCPEAIIEVNVLPKSRPSDKRVEEITKATKQVQKVDKELKKSKDRIKQGVRRLEEASKSTRWRI